MAASTADCINHFLAADHDSCLPPLQVSLPARAIDQLHNEPKDSATYRCFDVVGHGAWMGVDECKDLREVQLGPGFKAFQSGGPWVTCRCKGPCDVFDPGPKPGPKLGPKPGPKAPLGLRSKNKVFERPG